MKSSEMCGAQENDTRGRPIVCCQLGVPASGDWTRVDVPSMRYDNSFEMVAVGFFCFDIRCVCIVQKSVDHPTKFVGLLRIEPSSDCGWAGMRHDEFSVEMT